MAWSFPLFFGCLDDFLGRTFPVSFTGQDASDLALALLAGSARLALSRFGLEIWLMLHDLESSLRKLFGFSSFSMISP
jgi:hypothetical protein